MPDNETQQPADFDTRLIRPTGKQGMCDKVDGTPMNDEMFTGDSPPYYTKEGHIANALERIAGALEEINETLKELVKKMPKWEQFGRSE